MWLLEVSKLKPFIDFDTLQILADCSLLRTSAFNIQTCLLCETEAQKFTKTSSLILQPNIIILEYF